MNSPVQVMEVLDAIHSVWSKRSVGKALLVVGLAVAVYQVYSKWQARRLLRQKIREKVVLITGASSGLGEGIYMCCNCQPLIISVC